MSTSKRKPIPKKSALFGTWQGGRGAKDKAVDVGEKNGHALFMAGDVYLQERGKTTKLYSSFKNATSFLKKAQSHPSPLTGYGLYEVVRKGKECRLYADLEWPLTEDMTVQFVQKTIIDLIAEVLEKDSVAIRKHAKFTNACEGKKGSLHLVIPNFKFKDTTRQQVFWNEIYLLMQKKKDLWFLDQTNKSYIRKTFVDFSVYNSDRQIRILNAGKMRISDGKCVRPLLACDSDGEVMSLEESLSLPIKEKLKYFITHINGKEELIDTDAFTPKEVISSKRELWSKTVIDVVVKERLPGVEVREVSGRKVLLNIIPSNWCPLCGDCTGQHNAWLRLQGRKVLLKCFSAKQRNNQRLIYSMDRHPQTEEVGTSQTLLDVLEECKDAYYELLRKLEAEAAEEVKALSAKEQRTKKLEIEERAYQEWLTSTIEQINQVCVCISGESTSYVLYKDHARYAEDQRVSSQSLIYNERACGKIVEPPFTSFKVRNQPIIKMWLDNPNLRSYSYTDCVCENPTSGPPVTLGKNTFNSFLGLAIPQDEAILRVHQLERKFQKSNSASPSCSSSNSDPAEELKNFQDFLMKAWCEDDPVIYDYVVKWLAHQIQRPGQPLKVSLVLMGNEGCGKGSVIQVIGKILGARHFYQPRNPGDVLGNFNSLLQDCFLVFMDEMFWGGDKTNRGTLIKLVSEEKMTIEKKYSPQKVCNKRCNFMLASNEAWVIPATSKSRRFCVLGVSDLMLSLSAFEKSRIWNIDPHIIAKWLYSVELGDWNGQNYPKTQALTQQKLLGMPPIHRWWMDYLTFRNIGAEQVMVQRDLYEDYISSKHCPQNHVPSFQAWWAEVKDALLGNPTVRRIGKERRGVIKMLSREDLIVRFHEHYDGAQMIPETIEVEGEKNEGSEDEEGDPFAKRN